MKRSVKYWLFCVILALLGAGFQSRLSSDENILDWAAFITFYLLAVIAAIKASKTEEEERPRIKCKNCGEMTTFNDGRCVYCFRTLKP